MIRGLYAAVSASKAHETRLGTLLNNVANVQTTGYKQDKTANRGFYEMLISRLSRSPFSMVTHSELGTMATGTGAAVPIVDFSQGSPVETGRPLDLALNGPGFLAVQTPEGVRYTRDGNLRTDASGLLTQADGSPVLGVDGPLHLGQGSLRIDDSGAIFVDGEPAGRLRLVEIPPEAMKKAGSNYFEALDEAAVRDPEHTAVSQGFLESSNVDPARTVMELMEIVRSYAAAQECLRLQDEMLGRAVSEIGRLG